jgi:DNA modification methylase
MNKPQAFPPQGQLLLPLLESIADAGGKATPARVYDAVAERVALPSQLRQLKGTGAPGTTINLWERRIRNARQYATKAGYLVSGDKQEFNLWELTDYARDGLQNCRRGVVFTLYVTDLGAALYAQAESAVQMIADGSIDLIITSPPYPLCTQKSYGNKDPHGQIEWLLDCAGHWHRTLADTGSLVLNLGDAWQRGRPTLSLYQERLLLQLVDDLGYRLAQRFYWENPSKLPSPSEWVTIRRIRVTSSVEQIYWLSKSDWPKATNLRVLRPYSPSMRKRIRQGGEHSPATRPSGHTLAAGAFGADRGGSIPHNLLSFAPTDSNSQYLRRCKASGIQPHPARFDPRLVDFFIRFLTDPGDMVYDPFAGSGVTAQVAESLGRRWITSEKSLTYLRGSALRFEGNPAMTGLLDFLSGSGLAP